MFKSTNDIAGGQRFTLRVARQPSGKYKVHVPGTPELGAIQHDSSSQAIREMNQKISEFVGNGYSVEPNKVASLFGQPEQ
jgi:hypothetical protein